MINFPTNGPPTGILPWIKTGYTKAGMYTNGLTNIASILSSPYTAPASANANALSGLALGQVNFSGGNLTDAINDQIATTNSGPVFCDDSTMAIKFAAGGFVSGNFIDDSTGKTVNYYGVVQQSTTNAYGYFLGTNQSGAFTLEVGKNSLKGM